MRGIFGAGATRWFRDPSILPSGSIAAVTPVLVIKQQPTIIFYGAHTRLLEMLRVGPTIAVPAVVRKYSPAPALRSQQIAESHPEK